ncbi:MAG: pyruvate, phosphate dikinase [candidate division Zixibacteria bacterium]|nr:pyruvate, phosphate dikinase [candidate division Zixibacteria bacterium]
MLNEKKPIDKLIDALQERAKELNCLYRIEELMNKPENDIADVCEGIIDAIPPGWQYPDICTARIILDDKAYQSPNFFESSWVQSAPIVIQDKEVGSISVYYTEEMPEEDEGPFLKEERKLIHTICDRLAHFIIFQNIKKVSQEVKTAKKDIVEHKRSEWEVVLDLLHRTDKNLYFNVSHKMLNYLCWSGITKAEKLRQSSGMERGDQVNGMDRDSNRPHEKKAFHLSDEMVKNIFSIASEHLSDQEILVRLQKWMQEDKLSFLIQVVNRNLSLATVSDAIRRYHHMQQEGIELHSTGKRGVEVSLIRRFLSDQLNYINIAKQFIEVSDFYYLLQKVIFSAESHGKLGGKSAGLYLAAQILRKSTEYADLLGSIKVPRTWHITSDMLLHFMHYNNFDEIVEQKYKDINQIRYEYPHIVQTFKNSHFPPEMVKGLSVALDDFEERPLIVRSSSLLEDRMGSAFSGKYKSLFLANQGTKKQRLEALLDAIAEVYASTFSPDPIEYRAERGLIDFGEEMGIMIEEVVGTKIGHYFMPSFAGVAFSNNEFRWSPRIDRKDGLVRLVAGLGTRAVDRLADDYPVLIAPGKPNLRVNASLDEVIRYAPKYIDVINLETNSFETIEVEELLRNYGDEVPGIKNMISINQEGALRKPMGLGPDFEEDDVVITFDGLVSKTPFIKQMQTILKLLEEKLNTPVDIEFASDGHSFYLLQCRPQSYSKESQPAPIPKDVAEDKILFSANRYVSNGSATNITHIVFVDPTAYAELPDKQSLNEVGRAVGKLNKLLPKHQFILIGPGRWGSRGDIKLGVPVTYSDINNTAVLIEVARKQGNYVPDLSFGTHFFQDLVEAGIRYLPLYPDDDGALFNENFLKRSKNILPDLLPSYAHLKNAIHLIDIPRVTEGQVLHVFMNAELDEAIGLVTDRISQVASAASTQQNSIRKKPANYWRWRMRLADLLAEKIDTDKFGVKNLYVFGSTKNATAGPGSDIDILVHFDGDKNQRELLMTWLDGWDHVISEMNYQRTGYRTEKMLDYHLVTDEDIKNRTSYAVKIGAVTDAARPLKINKKKKTK